MRTLYLQLLFIFSAVLLTCNLFAQTDSVKTPSKKYLALYDTRLKFLNNGNWDSALIYADELLDVSTNEFGKLHENTAWALYVIGEIYRLKENHYTAYEYFKKSTETYTAIEPDIKTWRMYALAAARVGFMCGAFGATEEEKKYFKKAIQINNKIKNGENIQDNVQIYLVLANLYAYNGEYKKADSVYSFIKSNLDSLPKNSFNFYLQASIYANEGKIYNETGSYEKSIEFTKKALPLEVEAKYGNYPDDYVLVCLNLAAAYAVNNNMDSAWKFCRQAEDSLTETNRSYLTAQIIKEKAYLYQQQNNYNKAIELTKKFISIADTLQEVTDDYYATLVNLGTLYTSTKHYTSADSLFRKIIIKLQDSGLVYAYSIIQAKKGLCINLIKEKNYAEAADSLLTLINLDFEAMNKNFAGMSEAEKLNYQSEADKIFDLLYICLHNNRSTSQNIINNIYKAELERKGFVLRSRLNELNSVRNSNDTELANLYAAWQMNNELLAKQYSLPYNQRLFKIDSLEEINNDLERRVAAKSSLLTKQEKNILPASLPPANASANIEFVRYNYRSLSSAKDSGFYAAFISISADGSPHFTDLCSEQQLINLMKDEKGKWINENQLTQNIYNKQTSESKLIYALLWKKIDAYLSRVKIINYSTAGLLNNIAFPAIYNGSSYLINHYSFHRYFSLQQSFTAATNINMPKQINIWGDINYDVADYNSNSSLQNANAHKKTASSSEDDFVTGSSVKDMSGQPLESFNTDEVRNIKKLFADNGTLIHGSESSKATEDDFKQQSFAFSGILHISTHGFYMPYKESRIKSSLPSSYIAGNANALFRCGLAFAGVNYYWLNGKLNGNHDDGILTGYEISQLDLHNVQLVTLSACETGLGDVTNNEGDIGLQRAFKIAGVQTLLVSLWQVPAKQTSQLLTLFYKNWLQGKPVDEALRSAELIMQKQYPAYFWAGFVLIK